MGLPAFYYAYGESDDDPVLIKVRRFTEFGEQGDVKGTSFAYSEREAEIPKLIFWNADVTPHRTDVVMFGPNEGFRVDSDLPPYGQTTTCRVTRISASEAENYDFPPQV